MTTITVTIEAPVALDTARWEQVHNCPPPADLHATWLLTQDDDPETEDYILQTGTLPEVLANLAGLGYAGTPWVLLPDLDPADDTGAVA